MLIGNKEFVESVQEELFITDAFEWEGSAHVTTIGTPQVKENHSTLMLGITGSSTVEHEGDIDGIYDNVGELKGKEAVIDFFMHKYKVEIIKTDCRVTHGRRVDDGDYTVYIAGMVILKVTKL